MFDNGNNPISNNENSKLSLKFSVLAVITLGPRGITSQYFFTFGGPAPIKFWTAKTSEIRLDFGQLKTLIANISGMDNTIDKLTTAFSATGALKMTEMKMTDHRNVQA